MVSLSFSGLIVSIWYLLYSILSGSSVSNLVSLLVYVLISSLNCIEYIYFSQYLAILVSIGIISGISVYLGSNVFYLSHISLELLLILFQYVVIFTFEFFQIILLSSISTALVKEFYIQLQH